METYAEAQAEGERWMRDVAIRNFDMTGQFEDVTVLGLQPYENLTNCTAAPYAAYLLSKEAPSAEDLADAVDLARFSEDQFTFWDTPLTENGIKDKATPCVYEQYKYQKPVDNSACNVADAMLSLYEATGEEIYLAKGKALIDNITVVQNAVNGQIPTTWDFRPTKSDRNRTYWINCSYSSISSLLRLEKAPRRETKITFRHPAPQMRMAESVRHTHLSFDRSPLPHTTRRRRSGGPAGK